MTKKLEEYEWFCPQPFTNLVMNHDLVPKSCCVLKEWPSLLLPFYDPATGKNPISDVHTSEFMKKFRSEFLNGGGPISDKMCLVCKEQEKHSATESHRLMYVDKFDEKNGEYREHTKALEEYLETDQSDPMYLTFEYNAPNNFCNLKCNMCGPNNSSTFAKENKAIGVSNFTMKEKTWINIEDNMDEYEDILNTIVELKLVGGETLALPQNYQMMDKAIEMGVSKQMRLVMTTNATLTPKMGKHGDVFDYVPHFKECQMNVSIEFWGEKNNYLRFPSKWEKIMENVERFSKMPRTSILFASCVSSLSIGYLHEIAIAVDALIKKEPDIYNDFATGSLVLGEPNLYTVTAIPEKIRELYIQNIYEHAPPKHVKSFLKLTTYLTDMPFDGHLHKRMMKDVLKRDKFRGTCLTDVFPEWGPYYG